MTNWSQFSAFGWEHRRYSSMKSRQTAGDIHSRAWIPQSIEIVGLPTGFPLCKIYPFTSRPYKCPGRQWNVFSPHKSARKIESLCCPDTVLQHRLAMRYIGLHSDIRRRGTLMARHHASFPSFGDLVVFCDSNHPIQYRIHYLYVFQQGRSPRDWQWGIRLPFGWLKT